DGIRDRNVTGVQTCALPISARAGGRGPPPQSGCAQRSSRLAATPPPRWSPTGNHERPVPYCRHANYIEREEAEKRPPSWPDGWTNRGHFLRNRRGNRAIPPAERRPVARDSNKRSSRPMRAKKEEIIGRS